MMPSYVVFMCITSQITFPAFLFNRIIVFREGARGGPRKQRCTLRGCRIRGRGEKPANKWQWRTRTQETMERDEDRQKQKGVWHALPWDGCGGGSRDDGRV